MRVAVLANDKASFIRPMADGLARMLRDCGAVPEIHYDGIANLMRRQRIDISSPRSFAGSTLRLVQSRRQFAEFVERLRGVDLIVVVSHVPSSFSPMLLPNIELLRSIFPSMPIVNYDLVYLPTLDSWSRALLKGEKTGLSDEDLKIFKKGAFGMERYDWYLMVSVGTYIPLPPGPNPYTLIGLDIDDGSLFPEQEGKFQALLDFEQTRLGYPKHREIQLEALRLSGVDYVKLEGTYSLEEIRRIYRKSGILLLAHAESFGLPICEVQACGCSVFMADVHWVAAHWLGTDYHRKREPRLTENFVIYENDPHKLADRITLAAKSFDPAAVRATFLREQGILYHGDRAALAGFLAKVETGEIHSRLHEQHYGVGRPA